MKRDYETGLALLKKVCEDKGLELTVLTENSLRAENGIVIHRYECYYEPIQYKHLVKFIDQIKEWKLGLTEKQLAKRVADKMQGLKHVRSIIINNQELI